VGRVVSVAGTSLNGDDHAAEPAQDDSFTYTFPAIRGVQAGREYYVTMCPLRLIPHLLLFDEEELAAELRAQRSLNKARVPEITRYILDNPDNYVFSALTVSVDVDLVFHPSGVDTGQGSRTGLLKIPMSARFVINDGQHRRAAIHKALQDSPELGNESIAIVMFLDVGLNRSQQMFADLNRYAIRPSKSLGVLYDHRDEISTIAKLVMFRSPLLNDLTERESSNLATRSRKLFTLSAFHNADRALLDGVELGSFERRVDLTSEYWRIVAEQFPEWHQVHKGEVSAGEIRRDFIHTHGIVLHALGKVGNSLLTASTTPSRWLPKLRRLRLIDWRRTNAALWEGRAIVGGRVSKSAANVLLTTAAIRTELGLALPDDERRADQAFRRGER
jgi:DNA sulfur modification protein DndB